MSRARKLPLSATDAIHDRLRVVPIRAYTLEELHAVAGEGHALAAVRRFLTLLVDSRLVVEVPEGYRLPPPPTGIYAQDIVFRVRVIEDPWGPPLIRPRRDLPS